MWIPFVLVTILTLLIVIYRLSGFGGGAGLELLNASFASQQATVDGKTMPASGLLVVHRWRANAMTNRWGDILAIDANWLCRTPTGLFILAIGQGGDDGANYDLSPQKLSPSDIRWVWRNLSEDRVRQMLTPTPRIYRKVFGVPVPKR
ncbi:hypothetical protein [Dyella sp. 2RAB6]|uniref:hypothetical protein n=1 Tax=Dyella sp. 2RAB6 TaxID=3232992 RepID=UPI003F90B2B8